MEQDKMVPMVSIGMPVFNGAQTIIRALDSLLSQSFTDFELLISDNASTDNTEQICRQYALKDSRIIYVRQAENMGIGWNFYYVLKNSRSPYFMWASDDDLWEKDFILENLSAFKRDPTIIASMSKFEFLDGSVPPVASYPLMSTVNANVWRYLRYPYFNYAICSLYKREILMKCYDNANFYGHDWEIIIKSLIYGKYYLVDKVLFWRGLDGISTKGIVKNLALNKTHFFDRIFPMLPFAIKILTDRDFPFLVKTICFPWLVFYNIKFTLSLLKEKVLSKHDV